MATDYAIETDAWNLTDQLGPPKGDMIPLGDRPLPAAAAGFSDAVVVAQPTPIKRDVAAFLNRMKVLAQMAGEEYRYSFPVKGKNGSQGTVEGGSIKLANDLAREYGNCLVDVRVIDSGQVWTFYARFVDYETGFAMTRPFQQRKNQQAMKGDADRQLDIIYQIGSSKAIRNVVLNALQTYADLVYNEAKGSLVKKIGANLEKFRGMIIAGCQRDGHDLSRIERVVTRPIAEWTATDMARVIAELKSINDGMANFADIYPPAEGAPDPAAAGEPAGGSLGKFKAGLAVDPNDDIPREFGGQGVAPIKASDPATPDPVPAPSAERPPASPAPTSTPAQTPLQAKGDALLKAGQAAAAPQPSPQPAIPFGDQA